MIHMFTLDMKPSVNAWSYM